MHHRTLALVALLVCGAGIGIAGDDPQPRVPDGSALPTSLPEGVEAPTLKNPHARAEFPYGAKKKKLEARAILQVVVREDGSVDVSDVISCGTRKKSKKKFVDDPAKECLGFADSARDAVSQWRYLPATRDGEPIEVEQSLVVEWDLD
jgi:outer membrane biosynthesis protein TonB